MNANKEKNTHVLNVFIFLCVIFLVFLAFTGEKSISEIRMEMAEVQEEQLAQEIDTESHEKAEKRRENTKTDTVTKGIQLNPKRFFIFGFTNCCLDNQPCTIRYYGSCI